MKSTEIPLAQTDAIPQIMAMLLKGMDNGLSSHKIILSHPIYCWTRYASSNKGAPRKRMVRNSLAELS